MLSLFLSLIDKLIQFRKNKEESDRRFYSDFVAPAFADFEIAHKGYLLTFSKVRTAIAGAKRRSFPKLLKEIYNTVRFDSLESTTDRIKLRQLEIDKDDRILGEFIAAIIRYIELDFRRERLPVESPQKVGDPRRFEIVGGMNTDNEIRYCGIGSILAEVDTNASDIEREKESTIDQLDQLLGVVLINYKAVLEAHRVLKKRLLARK